MHPAFSVIFFTVASGAGFGLFSLLFIADFFKLGGSFSNDQLVAGGLIALALARRAGHGDIAAHCREVQNSLAREGKGRVHALLRR